MSTYDTSRQNRDSIATAAGTGLTGRERPIKMLWMVTFAAGMLFGALAVLLTSG